MTRACLCLSVTAISLLATHAAADIIRLRNGTTLDGQIIDDHGDTLRVRTTMGVSDIDKTHVLKIEPGEPPWVRYEKQKAAAQDTAADQFQLAKWCTQNGLPNEAKTHLEKVISLDPEHVEARRLLGYVRDGGKWVRVRSSNKPTDEEKSARRKSQQAEKLIANAIAEFTVKVKAIYRGRLSDKNDAAAFAEGRDKILEIKDPLAIPAITSVLSTGNVASRKLMVESLAKFNVDESTMNLIVIGLLDPSVEVRKLAGEALKKRKDDRIVVELRQALRSEEEPILRNAAVLLGMLKVRSAVNDLIAVLTTETIQPVRISRWVSLDAIYGAYSGGQVIYMTGQPVSYQPSGIGSLGPGSNVGTFTDYELHVVRVNRTEVQEALISITGQNLGFDARAWVDWARANPQG